jgi:predicted metal-dependent HD superfamily phosphohydrolase
VDVATQWSQTWNDLGLQPASSTVLDSLLARYSEPHRAYHTRHHLQECFIEFQRVRHLCGHPGEVQCALWYHDAIYDTTASDNEKRSAELAEEALREANASVDIRERIRTAIMATKHDEVPALQDACFVVDIDLSILGAARERFDEYERQIRLEYSWVPEAEFRNARRSVLQGFLQRDTIYLTQDLRGRYEKQARTNLQRSLARL